MAAPDWDSLALGTGASNDQHGDMHGRTLLLCENVLAHGAAVHPADATSAFQAAIDAASAEGGVGRVFIPSGHWLISSKLTIGVNGVRISGAGASVIAEEGSPGTYIQATFDGPMIERTETLTSATVIIEDLTLNNFHATGDGIFLAGVEVPSGVYRCNVKGQVPIEFGANSFMVTAANCNLTRGLGAIATSIGISTGGHTQITGCDISSFGQGIYCNGRGINITGGRFETNQTAVHCTGSASVAIIGFSMEANDTGIYLTGTTPSIIAMGSIHGSAGSPAGGSLIGIDIQEVFGLTVSSVYEVGSHATGFINFSNTANRRAVTLIDIHSTTAWSGFTTTSKTGTQIINCEGQEDVIRLPIIATASLPAAGGGENGRAIIEDGGAGDRNLILYGGGERFRIDGGAAF